MSSNAERSYPLHPAVMAGVVWGIDHLLITPDAFHVLDYKTNHNPYRTVGALLGDHCHSLQDTLSRFIQSDPDRMNSRHSITWMPSPGPPPGFLRQI